MKKILGQDGTDKLENRLELFKDGIDDIINNDDENGGTELELNWTMELHQGCRQIYTAETTEQKIQDELLKQMMKDFKIED